MKTIEELYSPSSFNYIQCEQVVCDCVHVYTLKTTQTNDHLTLLGKVSRRPAEFILFLIDDGFSCNSPPCQASCGSDMMINKYEFMLLSLPGAGFSFFFFLSLFSFYT